MAESQRGYRKLQFVLHTESVFLGNDWNDCLSGNLLSAAGYITRAGWPGRRGFGNRIKTRAPTQLSEQVSLIPCRPTWRWCALYPICKILKYPVPYKRRQIKRWQNGYVYYVSPRSSYTHRNIPVFLQIRGWIPQFSVLIWPGVRIPAKISRRSGLTLKDSSGTDTGVGVLRMCTTKWLGRAKMVCQFITGRVQPREIRGLVQNFNFAFP